MDIKQDYGPENAENMEERDFGHSYFCVFRVFRGYLTVIVDLTITMQAVVHDSVTQMRKSY